MAFVYARLDAVQVTSYCRLHAVSSALGLERRASSICTEWGHCLADLPDSKLCLCFPIYESGSFNTI